jgi:hypothetical protein
MEPSEIQARATIAAALIVSRAVEAPAIPIAGDWSKDSAALRLRELTDYVFQLITRDESVVQEGLRLPPTATAR